jgi:hypothetical protein
LIACALLFLTETASRLIQILLEITHFIGELILATPEALLLLLPLGIRGLAAFGQVLDLVRYLSLLRCRIGRALTKILH